MERKKEEGLLFSDSRLHGHFKGEGRNVSMTTVILTTQDSMTDSDPCSSSVVVTLADLGGQGLRSPQQLLCEPLEKLEQPWFF